MLNYHIERFRRQQRKLIATADQLALDLRRFKRETETVESIQSISERISNRVNQTISQLDSERGVMETYAQDANGEKDLQPAMD